MNRTELEKVIASRKTLAGMSLGPEGRNMPADTSHKGYGYQKGRYDALNELCQEILAGKYD